MGDVTLHFSRHEFDCRSGTPYPAAWVETRLRPLCADLEVIREVACDRRRVIVLSGYRTPKHNAKIGGAKGSQHLAGLAADLTCFSNVSATSLWARVRHLDATGRIRLGGLGRYDNRIHVDRGPRNADGSLREWDGRTMP